MSGEVGALLAAALWAVSVAIFGAQTRRVGAIYVNVVRSLAAAPGIILGMGIGRIGCAVAGDIFGKASSLPFSVEYTHLNSLAFARPPMQFVTAYEVLGDLLILGLLLALWKFRVFKRDGIRFFIYAFLYSAMRFGVSFFRIDKEIALGLGLAQLIALGVIAVSLVAFAAFIIRRPSTPEPEPAS